LQIDQCSILDKKSSMVMYKVGNIIQLTCMTNNPQPKKILNFQTLSVKEKSGNG
jgi:hypothetical protein